MKSRAEKNEDEEQEKCSRKVEGAVVAGVAGSGARCQVRQPHLGIPKDNVPSPIGMPSEHFDVGEVLALTDESNGIPCRRPQNAPAPECTEQVQCILVTTHQQSARVDETH
ncbi:hypothetical protein TYRP_007609 [Tyrophagus putrescentiae]|nr:hypothetical protein TYRP_007609 [Tyrophagus putrescentiae]